MVVGSRLGAGVGRAGEGWLTNVSSDLRRIKYKCPQSFYLVVSPIAERYSNVSSD